MSVSWPRVVPPACADFDGFVKPDDLRIGRAFYASCSGRLSKELPLHPMPLFIFSDAMEPKDDGRICIRALQLTQEGLFFPIKVCIDDDSRDTSWHYIKGKEA